MGNLIARGFNVTLHDEPMRVGVPIQFLEGTAVLNVNTSDGKPRFDYYDLDARLMFSHTIETDGEYEVDFTQFLCVAGVPIDLCDLELLLDCFDIPHSVLQQVDDFPEGKLTNPQGRIRFALGRNQGERSRIEKIYYLGDTSREEAAAEISLLFFNCKLPFSYFVALKGDAQMRLEWVKTYLKGRGLKDSEAPTPPRLRLAFTPPNGSGHYFDYLPHAPEKRYALPDKAMELFFDRDDQYVLLRAIFAGHLDVFEYLQCLDEDSPYLAAKYMQQRYWVVSIERVGDLLPTFRILPKLSETQPPLADFPIGRDLEFAAEPYQDLAALYQRFDKTLAAFLRALTPAANILRGPSIGGMYARLSFANGMLCKVDDAEPLPEPLCLSDDLVSWEFEGLDDRWFTAVSDDRHPNLRVQTATVKLRGFVEAPEYAKAFAYSRTRCNRVQFRIAQGSVGRVVALMGINDHMDPLAVEIVGIEIDRTARSPKFRPFQVERKYSLLKGSDGYELVFRA